MKDKIFDRFAPPAAWLILVSAIATLFPLKLELIFTILTLAGLLSISWLPSRRTRSAALVIAYLGIIFLAQTIPFPLPDSWPPIARLALTLGVWSLLLCITLTALIYLLFRTHQHAPDSRRQSQN